jgi:sugar/nucleoside kinase (ribokinase family)
MAAGMPEPRGKDRAPQPFELPEAPEKPVPLKTPETITQPVIIETETVSVHLTLVEPAPTVQRPLPEVLVAGHLCLDIFPDLSGVPDGQFPQLFKPGRMVVTGPMTFATGGAASNTSLALARLGMPVRMVAKTGLDPFAEIVREIVRSHAPGLEQGILSVPDAATSYTVIISAPGIDRIFLHCTGANDTFVAGDVDFKTAGETSLFHFGYPPLLREFYRRGGRELTELFKQAQQAGLTTSLDLTLPDPANPAGQADWLGILGEALPYVDIFLPSLEEILFMLRRKTYDVLQEAAGSGSLLRLATPELLHSLSTQLLDMGVKIVGLKLGERGIYLRTAHEAALAGMGRGAPADPAAWADQTLWAPGFEVVVAGTTGAGDSAIAGFISALLRGLGPRAALCASAAVGACNVEAADALSGLRPWEDTLARIASGWPQRSLNLSSTEWIWDSASVVNYKWYRLPRSIHHGPSSKPVPPRECGRDHQTLAGSWTHLRRSLGQRTRADFIRSRGRQRRPGPDG